MIDAPLLSLEGLTVGFGDGPVVRHVSLDVRRGEALGLVGESGSGKSVTWLAALGLLPKKARISGSARLEGTELVGAGEAQLTRVRGKRIAYISQDPTSALNPVLTIGRQLSESLMLHRGLSQDTAMAETKRLMDAVGLPDPGRRVKSFPHELSGGQNQRVMIAMALAGEPDLLIADEPTTALDVTIQAQILDLLNAVRRATGMALVLISHDLGIIAETCERVAVMYAGRIVEEASAEALFRAPLHPYTQGLMGSLPTMAGPRQRLIAIAGVVPEPKAKPPGCAFAPRCAKALAACTAQRPALATVAPRHRAACLLVNSAAPAPRALAEVL